jgi:diguanylate cyclase (GGDEF)-like protein
MKPKLKILIVDNQKINRKILSRFLSDFYEIIEADNGRSALTTLRSQKGTISAVLLDPIMPIMNGYDVLRAMSKDPQMAAIPVIVISQDNKQDSEIKALQMGARDFISTPYNPKILRRRLSNLIELYESNLCIGHIERDTLTGVYTKDAFYRHATEILSSSPTKPYILVATDIERFKLVNDSFGSTTGDELLQYIAKILQHASLQLHGICARHSEDHFMILIPKSTDDGNLHSFIEAAQKELKQFPLNMKISLKFGVYLIENLQTPIPIMCDRAILAVESAKGHYEKSCAYYDDSIRQRLLREQQIIDEMKSSLEKNRFEVFLQPKYDLSNEKIVGAESLVRWTHPKLGALTPGEFIPLFEHTGFITELDKYVWNRTCEILENWNQNGLPHIQVSVNVSRKDIYQENLPEIIWNIVKKHGLQPSQLHLEITETAYTENAEQLISVVNELKKIGFLIEMDDFGTGYSSLNMLSELPIDILKLDMRFMNSIKKGALQKNKHNILEFIIKLAKWINLQVVAEGVEKKGQVDFLRKLGCNYAQGYYYAKPMPVDEFTKLLNNSNVEIPSLPHGCE